MVITVAFITQYMSRHGQLGYFTILYANRQWSNMLNSQLERNKTLLAMKKLKLIPYIFSFVLLLAFSCSEDGGNTVGTGTGGNNGGNSGGNSGNSTWLIPSNQVFNGGPGKDGIPSIDSPQFSNITSVDALNFMEENDLVIGIKVGDDIRAYPHPILDWHEIVNDEVGGIPIAITYCPLTGTAIGWERTIENTETTFGVSGLLYNTNLMPYDRASNSVWSQMLLTSVNGDKISTVITTYPLVETSWGQWKQLFPNSQVLDIRTGFNRTYGAYPYGDYKTNNSLLLFPITNEDSRIATKERGLGVNVDDQSRFYRFQHFTSQSVVTINDEMNGTNLVIAGSSTRNFIVAYNSEIEEGVVLNFTAVTDGNEVIMKDDEGNRWTIFGEALEGPYQGQTLKPVTSYIGMWFAWATFHPNIQIYQG